MNDLQPTKAIISSVGREQLEKSASSISTAFAQLASAAAERPGQGSSGTAAMVLSILANSLVSRSALDARLSENLKTIASFRNARDGWDGRDAIAPDRSTLNAAEMLSSLFSQSPIDKRLHLMVGTDGKPAFASNTKRDYIHLVIDPGPQGSNHHLATLSLYAVHDGKEEFIDEVPFDGRAIPDALMGLIDPDGRSK